MVGLGRRKFGDVENNPTSDSQPHALEPLVQETISNSALGKIINDKTGRELGGCENSICLDATEGERSKRKKRRNHSPSRNVYDFGERAMTTPEL